MKNFVAHGDALDVTAPRALLSGEGCLVGLIFGVSGDAVANGDTAKIKTNGVFDLTALSTDAAAVGAAAYWDNTAFRITTTVGSNTKVGVFVRAKTNGQTTAVVRLNAVF